MPSLVKLLLSSEARQKRMKAKQREAARKHKAKQLKKEANYYVPRISEACWERQIMHVARKDLAPDFLTALFSGKRRYQRVKIAEVAANEGAIFFRVHHRLPWGSSYGDLANPETLRTISHWCRRPVRFTETPEAGFWYILDRLGSTYRIPKLYKFGDALKRVLEADPPLPALSICIGAAEDGEIIIEDLQERRAVLVAGEIGSGKSVFTNSALIMLAWRNSDKDLKFFMIDLKDGQELGDYDVLPHMLRPVAKTPEEAIAALGELTAILHERGAKMGARGCRTINEWNKLYPDEKFPLIVAVIDELAELLKSYNKKIRQEGELLLGSLLATGRARGVYWILCTQTPRREIVSGHIKANAPTRLCFSVASQAESRIVIGTAHAWQLEPAGRAAYRRGSKLSMLQAPFISSATIYRAIKAIQKREGVPTQQKKEWNVIEILQFALATYPKPFGAMLPWQPLYNHFNKEYGISQLQMRDLLESLEDRVLTVNGEEYQIKNLGPGSNQGRRLIRYTPAQEPIDEPVIETSGNGHGAPVAIID
jgi:hypothetical protein